MPGVEKATAGARQSIHGVCRRAAEQTNPAHEILRPVGRSEDAGSDDLCRRVRSPRPLGELDAYAVTSLTIVRPFLSVKETRSTSSTRESADWSFSR